MDKDDLTLIMIGCLWFGEEITIEFTSSLELISCPSTSGGRRAARRLGINDEKQVTKLFVWTDRFVRSA